MLAGCHLHVPARRCADSGARLRSVPGAAPRRPTASARHARPRAPRCCAAAPAHRIQFTIREAAGSAELRAASYLRAQSFYQCPDDRSEYAKRAYLRLKADAQWAEMERRAAGNDTCSNKVTTLIAIAPGGPSGGGGGPDLLAQLADRSTALPRPQGELAQVVVATLDLNQGPTLPAEELIGQQPAGGDAKRERAYLSNVCVLSAARRQGIAQALIRDAAHRAAAAGVTSLYVHVVADNEPARRLYEAERFQAEQEESEDVARRLNRPRRLLLHRLLSDNMKCL